MQSWELAWERSRDIGEHVSLESLDTHRCSALGPSLHSVPPFDERQWHRHKLTQLKLIYTSYSIEGRSFYFIFSISFWITRTQIEKLSTISYHLFAPDQRETKKWKSCKFHHSESQSARRESKWWNQNWNEKWRKQVYWIEKSLRDWLRIAACTRLYIDLVFLPFFSLSSFEQTLGMRCG